ncbi:hypothetical protein MHU86_25573 [Fragilaria crotonensis]|nr:hypothetical protein MHU86_25573 [Fragilaria crotonensis]
MRLAKPWASAKEKRSSSCATDGKNGVCHNGQDDIHADGNNGKEDDDLVFEVDSDSDQDDDLLFDVDGDSDNEGDVGGYDGPCLPNRPERKFLPSQRQAMLLLSMAVPPEDRAHFKERYHAFATGKETSPCPLAGTTRKVCNTNVAWIAAAYGCDFVHQLQCARLTCSHSLGWSHASSARSTSWMSSSIDRLDENRTKCRASNKEGCFIGGGGEDDVLLVRSYHEDDLDDKNDFKFRTMILFLPQCGVFYCARERRKEDVGVAKTHVALDMSWLRLERSTDSNGRCRTPSARRRNRQSVIMVRNVNFLTDDGGEDLLDAMACITKHNKALRLAKKKGAARSNAGDYGTMHAIGTHVHLDGVTTSAYKANEAVGEALLRKWSSPRSDWEVCLSSGICCDPRHWGNWSPSCGADGW